MGKDKTGQRTKNNARPSSSGRTAEMLGSAPLNPFLSFASLQESFGKDDQTFDPNIDPNFQLLLKKMSKKDSLTKLKALQEFQQLCKTSEADAVIAILPFWPRLYSTLALDTDHRIREATQLAHSAVLSQVKRNIAPFLKLLVGPWFISQCDIYAPVASAASQAFKETFPEEKLPKAISHCQYEILNYLIENLTIHTPQTLCNSKKMTPEEMESKYLRTITSSLHGYSLYLRLLKPDQVESARELHRKLVSDQKFWKYSKHQTPQIRSAWFKAIISLCQNAQFLLEGEERRVGFAIFNVLDENEASVLPVVWEAALVALVTLDGLQDAISFDDLILPKLWRVCSEAGSGCAAVIFPSLLPLLSKLPQQNDPQGFYNKLFTSLQTGFMQRSVQQSPSESKAVASAFIECIQYVFQRHQDNQELCTMLLRQQLLPLVISSFMHPQWKTHVSDALNSSICKLLHAWGKSNIASVFQKLLCIFCTDLSNVLKKMTMYYLSCCSEVENFDDFDANAACMELHEYGTIHCEGKDDMKSLGSVLNSQVNFIILLLKGDVQPQKVKFNDETSNVSEVKNDPSAVTIQKVAAFGTDLCCCYLKLADRTKVNTFLPPLVTLAKSLRSHQLFLSMAKSIGYSSEEELFPMLLSNWLKPNSKLLSRHAVTLSTLLLLHLPAQYQTQLLNCVLQYPPNATLWLWVVEEGILADGTVAMWVRSPDLFVPLKVLIEGALLSEEEDTWALLSQGSELARDGDHVLSCTVLREVVDVIVKRMETLWVKGQSLPPWIPHAVDVLQKLFIGQTPFFRSLPDPHISLSTLFQTSLFDLQDVPERTSISTVWKNGAHALACVHGPTSHSVATLCSTLKKYVLMLLFEMNSTSISLPMRISSHLSDLIVALTSSCVSETEKVDACALLINELFQLSDSEPKSKELDELVILLQAQRNSLQMLANWVHLEFDNISDLEAHLSALQVDLVALCCWGLVMASVLEKVTKYCFVTDDNDSPQLPELASGAFSIEAFMDAFILFSDIKCIVNNYSSTEVGSALQQPYFLMENSFSKILEIVCKTCQHDLHNHFKERANHGASWSRAHEVWHIMTSLSEECSISDSRSEDLPPAADSIEDVDLSPLQQLSRDLTKNSANLSVKSVASQWLHVAHSLHLCHSHRLLLSSNVESASFSNVFDAHHVMTFLEALITHTPDLLESRNWDSTMVAVASWIHSSHDTVLSIVKNNQELRPSRLFIHLRGVCRLFVALNKTLVRMQEGNLKLDGLNESLPREWSDVFAGECEHKLLAIWTTFVENINPSGASPLFVTTLDELGFALQHSSVAFLVPSKGASVKYQPLVELAPQYLLHKLSSVRLAAYHLLLKVVPHMVQSDAEMLAAVTSKLESGDIPLDYAERLTLPQFEDTLIPAQTIVSTMLSDIRLGSTCTVQPFTDAYTYTSGYLLVWSLMLEMCKAAETELRYQYAIWMKNASSNCVEELLNNIFRLLPDKVLQQSEGKKKTGIDAFTKKPSFAFQECWNSSWIENMGCFVLLEALGRLPALARQWWNDCEPKAASMIERVVSEYLSPLLYTEELNAVAKMQDKAVDNMIVRVHSAVREVVATYTVDDLAMELIVRLPSNHPLTPMTVEVGKRDSAAAAGQWRQWLMQLTMFLTHQNGSLWDGLALWRNNVVRRYEGVEECYICFCVLSGPNFQLPKLSCRTCRKKFHSNCLYKWFQTSNKSTCPICRNLF